MKYTINYNTGAGNETYDTNEMMSLRALADEGAAYTQQPITIEDENGSVICYRTWYDVKYDADDDSAAEDPIEFGMFGHYGDWQGDDCLD